jgi:ABC-2 type transport system permease protein
MRNSLLALLNETYKRLLIIWTYKFNILTQLITVGLIFLGLSFLVQRGRFDPSQSSSILLGYVVWFYARIVIMSTSGDWIGEARSGTLEQMYMSPAPTWVLLLGRMFALLVSTTIMVLLPTLSMVLLFGIRIPLRWEAIPILLITLAGLFGFTLVLSGAALVFKQIDELADLVQNTLLFLTGSLLPVSRFPDWLEAVAKTLPITQGIIVLRNVVLGGQSLLTAWTNGSLPWLLFHSTIYVGVGWLIFRQCEIFAKKQGSLGQY